MTDSLLDDDTDTVVVDPNKDYLTELVGDDKKFKTPQELARGKYEADLYVKTLEKQKDELRSDYLKLFEEQKTGAKLQDLIDRLDQKQQLTSSDNNPNANEVDEKPVIDLKQIESLVSTKVQEIESTKKQAENYNIVKAKLQERFGSNFKAALKEQADNLGLSGEDVDVLARKSPTAFIKTFGLDSQPNVDDNFRSPPRTERRSDNFSPNTQKRDWAYYQNLKKADPKIYLDPKTSVQMHNDVLAMGEEAFYARGG